MSRAVKDNPPFRHRFCRGKLFLLTTSPPLPSTTESAPSRRNTLERMAGLLASSPDSDAGGGSGRRTGRITQQDGGTFFRAARMDDGGAEPQIPRRRRKANPRRRRAAVGGDAHFEKSMKSSTRNTDLCTCASSAAHLALRTEGFVFFPPPDGGGGNAGNPDLTRPYILDWGRCPSSSSVDLYQRPGLNAAVAVGNEGASVVSLGPVSDGSSV